MTAQDVSVGENAAPRVRKPALSPSRASDFKQCPLLYRFRVVDRIPEVPGKAQVRGTLVHSVLEKLFGLPHAERVAERAQDLLRPTWTELAAEYPEWTEIFDAENPNDVDEWLDSAAQLVSNYFSLEDPRLLSPESCELHVEIELESGLALRGYIDRLDVAPTGEIRVVDYKTGVAPREYGEMRAMFQMKFYALALWRLRNVVPTQLKLLYLAGDGQSLTYQPDADELARFERALAALWSAILRAGETGNFAPKPGKLCGWCSYQTLCPAFGGTPPEYPGWPTHNSEADTAEASLDL